jgi:hypothetical protein
LPALRWPLRARAVQLVRCCALLAGRLAAR